ncbi:MAG: FAD:protein FMN transferase [Planctomycetota bacterium]|nr:MAG: FAD:protein FMN transferase [Planctomycetota bacterium]
MEQIMWRWVMVLSFLLVGPALGSSGEPNRFEFTRIVMGCRARIVFYTENEAAAREIAQAVFARLNALDAVMSDYRSDSELMRLCAQPAGKPVRVSDDLLRVLAIAREVSERTGGAFDATVGPAVRLWREARKTGVAPTSEAIERALARSGWQHCRIDAHAGTVTLAIEGMQLDLGGIGKGFAADEAIGVLRAHGIDSALVDLGGDVVVSAAPPGTPGWRVRIDDGRTEPRQVYLSHAAIATSGDLEQHVIIDGVRYSHIIDPRTGQALTHSAASTVLAPTGALADALASACCVLSGSDDERGLKRLAEAFSDIEATASRGVSADGDEGKLWATEGMPGDGEKWSR